MVRDGLDLALAGLLHDVGKLYGRALWGERDERLPDRTHTAYTAHFVQKEAELFRRAGLDPDWLAKTASRHHEGWRDRPQYQPQSPEEWCVALADTYASQEREEGGQGGSPPEVPLKPPFSQLRLQGKEGRDGGYLPVGGGGRVGLAPGALYPEASVPMGKATYGRLVERLEARLSEMARLSLTKEALLLNLALAFQEVLSLVPADTQSEPDVSLYDHLRLTAAIAHALWLYHDGQPSVEELRRDGKKFLLVVGDLGGIQGHIYRISGAETGVGGIAKRLRARSLEVSLAAETMALGILRSLGLTPLNRILGAGGKFYLLLPNTEEARKVLEEAREAWGRWALRRGGSLVPNLASLAFEGAEFRDFAGVLKALHKELALAKLKPFPFLKKTEETRGEALRPCAACGLRPALKDEPGSLCPDCERERKVGGLLPKSDRVGFFPEEAPRPFFAFPSLKVALEENPKAVHVFRAELDFRPSAAPTEAKPLLGHLPRVAHALKAQGVSLADYTAWAREEGLLEEEEGGEDRVLTFGELAALSQGAPYLGALMLDADRMGEAFATGFQREERDLATPSRLAALSRTLEVFFATEVLELIRNPALYAGRLGWDALEAKGKGERYPLIYSVYSGGDDLFLLGPWDVLLDFALDLERLYALFTGHEALTLSGGFVLAGPSLPIPELSRLLTRAEKAAKEAGRGRLFLFGQAVPWAHLRNLRQEVEALRSDLRAERVSRAQVYRWLALWRRFWGQDMNEGERMRYKPLLAYALRRVRERDERAWERYMGLLDHQGPAWRYLPVWVQWGLYLERRA
ncbi:type III-A CRISPR-associated protein Cas10/Csm1 [Thermus sp.]|uniref:type III-A CRISPR-associated protein Cas10/Csm1 n=1 Tax=Thermus sp. TaxID=275 RepID=UPI0028CE9814|nr:type III-A CRISPR-associated protein Cas10/Csm1 [Thermus sp.]MDT7910216.1 type III-A CRISPR-associated protein Cas10/Csm1 [Thermus sp.]